MGDGLAKLKLVLEVDGQGNVIGGLRNVDASVTSVGDKTVASTGRMAAGMQTIEASAGRMSTAMSEAGRLMTSTFGGVETALKSLMTAWASWELIQKAKNATLFAANVEQANRALSVIANTMGKTSEEAMKYRDSLRDLGITTNSSTNAVAQFMKAGLPLDQLNKLGRAAQGAAISYQMMTGETISSSEALDKMIRSLVTGNVTELHTLGINVMMRDTLREYKKETGEAATSVDSHKRHLLMFNEVLEKTQPLMQLYEASMDLASKQISSSKRPIEELRLALGNLFLPELTVAATAFYQTVSGGMKWVKAHNEEMNTAKSIITEVTKGLGFAIAALAIYSASIGVASLATTGMTTITGLLTGALATMTTTLSLTGAPLATTTTAVGLFGETVSVASTKATLGLMSVKAAFGVLAAAFTGWEIGTYLQNSFEWARKLGVAIVAFFTGIWEGLKGLVTLDMGILDALKNRDIGALKKAWDDASKGVADYKENIKALWNDTSIKPVASVKAPYKDNQAAIAAGIQTEKKRLAAEAAAAAEAAKTASDKAAAEAEKAAAAARAAEQKHLHDLKRAKEEYHRYEDQLADASLAKTKNARELELADLELMHGKQLVSEAAYLQAKNAINQKAAQEQSATLAEEMRKATEAAKAAKSALTRGTDGKLTGSVDQVSTYHKAITDEVEAHVELEKAANTQAITGLKEQLELAKQLSGVKTSNDALGISLIDDPSERQKAQIQAEYELKADSIQKEIELRQQQQEQEFAMMDARFERVKVQAEEEAIIKYGKDSNQYREVMENQKQAQEVHDAAKIKAAQKTAGAISKLEDLFAKLWDKKEADKAKVTEDSYKSQLSMVANYVGVGATLFSKLAESQDQSSREGFEAAKKYNTAAAGMSMAAGIIGAFAGNGTMYEKIANAAIVAATGAAQIAAIEKTAFGGSGSSVSFSGSAAGAGANGGGVAGSSIGNRYVSVQDSQTAESLQALADSADNASMAIGKIVDGFSKISDMFATGGYANMFMGNAPGINNLVKSSPSPYTAQNMSLFTSGTGLVANMLFGLGNKFVYKGSALMLGGTSQNVAAADVDEYRKAGGLFGGGKTKYDIKYDKEWSEFAQGLVTTITTSINRMAITLGTSANIGNIAIPGTAIQTTGRTAEQISADVQKWLQNVAATLAGTIPELEKFAFAGENYYLALTRLNDALVSTNQRLQEIGAHLIDSTLAGANAAYKLQDLMGGSEAFATKMETYFTSIFTDAEQKAAKLATAQRLVNNAFAEMGATGITTRAQFKALVNSLDLTTEFGARTFAALMDISEAFGTVTEEAEKTVQALLKTLADAALEAANTLKDIMGGSLSTKSPTQIYEEQRKAFAEALAAGRTAELPELGKALLEISRTYNASGAAYISDYDMVTKALMDLAGLSGTPTIDKVQAQINILTDIRDALETQNQAQLAALSGMLGVSSPLYVALQSYLQQMVTAQTTTDSVLNAMKIADINKQISTTQASLATAATAKDTAASNLTSGSQFAQLAVMGGFWSMAYGTSYIHGLESASSTAAQQWQALSDQLSGLQAQLAALQSIPKLAGGGITNGLSWAGDGVGNEAVIPLPDGRTVPVMLRGGADNQETVAELKETNRQLAASVRVLQAGFNRLIEISEAQEKRLQGMENNARLAAAA